MLEQIRTTCLSYDIAPPLNEIDALRGKILNFYNSLKENNLYQAFEEAKQILVCNQEEIDYAQESVDLTKQLSAHFGNSVENAFIEGKSITNPKFFAYIAASVVRNEMK